MTVEVIRRCVEDRGGGLARVKGHLRLIEGLAMPREEDEFALSYYNSNTMWIDIDRLLNVFGLARGRPGGRSKVSVGYSACGRANAHLHHAQGCQEALGTRPGRYFPVVQFEKLWGDMTALPEMDCRFVAVASTAWPEPQRCGAARWLAARWVGGLCAVLVRVGGLGFWNLAMSHQVQCDTRGS